MKKFALLAVSSALVAASPAAFAGYYSTTSSLTGYVSATGFNDGDSKTFSLTLSGLNGLVQVNVPPSSSSASVDVSGFASLTPYAGLTISRTVSNPLSLFTGALVPTGLTAGTYNVPFSSSGHTFIRNVNFAVDYDGTTNTSVLGFLNLLLGTSFVDPNGKGSLGVTGSLYSDGAVLNITESNLNWVGFGALIAAADLRFDPHQYTPNFADGTFVLRDVVVHVPEPTSMALLGLGVAGLAAVRRRKSA